MFPEAADSRQLQDTAGQVDLIIASNGQPTIQEGTFASADSQASTQSVRAPARASCFCAFHQHLSPSHTVFRQSFLLLNYTTLAPSLRNVPGVVGAGKRASVSPCPPSSHWHQLLVGSFQSTCEKNIRVEVTAYTTPLCQQREAPLRLPSPVLMLCRLVILDEEAESALGIGRSWPHPAVGDGEAVAVDALMRSFGIVSGTGQRLALSLPLDRLAATGGADISSIAGDDIKLRVRVHAHHVILQNACRSYPSGYFCHRVTLVASKRLLQPLGHSRQHLHFLPKHPRPSVLSSVY